MPDDPQIIIIKRKNKRKHGAHGGAWKIALADFAIAMMAFFLVLWLIENTSTEEKQAIAGYFQEPSRMSVGMGGVTTPIDLEGNPLLKSNNEVKNPLPAESLSEEDIQVFAEQQEREKLQILLGQLNQQINDSNKLAAFKDQIILDITSEGLRIQIVDKTNRPMFSSGSSQMMYYSEDILFELAGTIKTKSNKISITGHTDAILFSNNEDFSNWELSADRANAARRVLVEAGLPETQVAEVVGLASSVLFDKEDPNNPINRRIEIIVLNKKTEAAISGSEQIPNILNGIIPVP